MKRSTIIFIAIAAVLAVTIIAVYLTGSHNGTVALTVTPADAVVQVDNGDKKAAGTFKLAEGDHIINISRAGYLPSTITVTVTGGTQQSRSVTLLRNSQTLEENLSEAATGQTARREGAAITANNPILEHLPYQGGTFKVDFGPSVKDPSSPQIALYVIAANEVGRSAALAWIRANGADPTTYEIIYQTP